MSCGSRGGRAFRSVLLLFGLLLSAPAGAGAQSVGREPAPDPNFAVDIAPRPCAFEGDDPFERRMYALERWQAPEFERYPGSCTRMRFAYGPIHVKPGQNDVLVEPVTIQKPTRNGYITRFKPNLVLQDGKIPPVEQVHLHHGTWLNLADEYGSGPFFASGEEKTIAPFPRGYGMPVKTTDTWQLLYMVHSAVQNPMEVFITYDVDFVPQEAGEALGMKPAYPLWTDVRPSGYPVFNVQRSFGGADGTCQWPREQCAAHDPFGKEIVGQGQPGNGKGQDVKLPAVGESFGRVDNFTGGTLIGIGGHVHPGGLTNDVDLVRPGGQTVQVKEKVKSKKKGKKGKKRKARYRTVTKKVESTRIFTGQARYWDRQDRSKWGGPPNSWDHSSTVVGLPYWGVHVKPGDVLRVNATYDTKLQSTYENMGIAVGLLVPNDEQGRPQAPGIDPLVATATNAVDRRDECPSGGIEAKKPKLCDKGIPTHGHYKENGNYGEARGAWGDVRTGSQTSEVGVVDFLYMPGDLSMISMTGVPTVKLGSTLRFTDLEGPLIYHTATSCKFPCLGPTGAAFPLADGATSTGRQLDFDSSEMGVGIPSVGPTKMAFDYKLPVTPESGFKPGEIVTYFCRIHPGMRGAFEVSE